MKWIVVSALLVAVAHGLPQQRFQPQRFGQFQAQRGNRQLDFGAPLPASRVPPQANAAHITSLGAAAPVAHAAPVAQPAARALPEPVAAAPRQAAAGYGSPQEETQVVETREPAANYGAAVEEAAPVEESAPVDVVREPVANYGAAVEEAAPVEEAVPVEESAPADVREPVANYGAAVEEEVEEAAAPVSNYGAARVTPVATNVRPVTVAKAKPAAPKAKPAAPKAKPADVQPRYNSLDAHDAQASENSEVTAARDGDDSGSDSEGSLEETIPGTPGTDYPIYAEAPETSFSCDGKVNGGYYVDADSQCQAFHICVLTDTVENTMTKNTFLCPNGTTFNQQYFICDWWFNVNCEESVAAAEGRNADLQKSREEADVAAAARSASDNEPAGSEQLAAYHKEPAQADYQPEAAQQTYTRQN